MNTYRIKIIKAGLELEVEGDKKFVLDMLDRFDKGGEHSKPTTTKKSELTVTEISTNKSLLTSEKLLMKFKGFCISCAMPAVSSPREAIFSD